jgi:hypothetical protein
LSQTVRYSLLCEPERGTERIMGNLMNSRNARLMRSHDVFLLLNQYNPKIAGRYYAYYVTCVTKGQREAKTCFPERTCRSMNKVFRDLGISFVCSDLERQLDDTEFEKVRKYLADFSFSLSEDYPYYQLWGS